MLAPGGVPTMDVNDNACCLNARADQTIFASKHRSYREMQR